MVESRSAAIASWLLFAASALAPLPFGSNQPIAIAFWCMRLTCSGSAGQFRFSAGVTSSAWRMTLAEAMAAAGSLIDVQPILVPCFFTAASHENLLRSSG